MKWTGKHDGEALAGRLRKALGKRRFTEKHMFSGVCFMVRGNMLCGTAREGLMFRVGKEQHSEATRRKGAREMKMGGRVMQGFLWVDPDQCDARGLKAWLALAERYVAALPAKKGKTR